MTSPAGRYLLNGSPVAHLEVDNRGLAYGDGAFETLLLQQGQPLWLDAHLDRLQHACKLLKIQFDRSLISSEVLAFSGAFPAAVAVLKIVIFRQAQGRGYGPHSAIPERLLTLSPSAPQPDAWQGGVEVVICRQRLASPALLPGVKHLNRLEQVMAAAELLERAAPEGLMFDTGSALVEGTRSNVFLVRGGQLHTPALDRAGVAGIMRNRILAAAERLGICARVGRLSYSDLGHADEVLVCNSVFGIWPVTKIECLVKPVGPITRQLQQEFEECFNC